MGSNPNGSTPSAGEKASRGGAGVIGESEAVSSECSGSTPVTTDSGWLASSQSCLSGDDAGELAEADEPSCDVDGVISGEP